MSTGKQQKLGFHLNNKNCCAIEQQAAGAVAVPIINKVKQMVYSQRVGGLSETNEMWAYLSLHNNLWTHSRARVEA